jgi:hypothetical protein
MSAVPFQLASRRTIRISSWCDGTEVNVSAANGDIAVVRAD